MGRKHDYRLDKNTIGSCDLYLLFLPFINFFCGMQTCNHAVITAMLLRKLKTLGSTTTNDRQPFTSHQVTAVSFMPYFFMFCDVFLMKERK